jgi:ankyrin repeat protein
MRYVVLALMLIIRLLSRSVEEDLIGAVRAGDVARSETLLATGADVNQPAGVNDWPPLMHAVHKKQLRTAEVLLKHGADVNRGGRGGMTPLMMAAGYGDTAMVELLLRHHADPQRVSQDGSTALDYALTGTSDIDDFTLFRCHDSVVALLARSHVAAKPSSRTFARLKHCWS